MHLLFSCPQCRVSMDIIAPAATFERVLTVLEADHPEETCHATAEIAEEHA